MGTALKTFCDGSSLEFDRGSFDDWCVYLRRPDGTRRAPKDEDYFRMLAYFAREYGAPRVYADFVSLYDQTGKDVDPAVLDACADIAAGYQAHPQDSLRMEKTLDTLYLAMIAEERRAGTRLGRRIKRLGIHALLVEGESLQHAVSFMTGMKWNEIDALCRRRGF